MPMIVVEEPPPKRLFREFTELNENLTQTQILNLKCGNNNNLYLWTCLLLPDYPPYNTVAYALEINIPLEYPFKPPIFWIKTKIYHPNINEKGEVCLAIILIENWKPTTTIDMALQALLALINTPVLENPYRLDVADQYIKDNKKFMRIADEQARKFGEHRPDDEEIATMLRKKKIALKNKK